ncbi:MAG TPA: PaaI family thioesterase [Bacteroidota bacterium]
MTLQERYPQYADIIDLASPDEWLDRFFQEITAFGSYHQGAISFPPACFRDMRARFVRYESRALLVVRLPVLERYCNPVGTMQGGFVTAAIDNTIGPLSYMAARRPCSTLDLHTQYIRAVLPGDELTITGRVVSRAVTTLVLGAEAVNRKGRTVAIASATAAVQSA